MLKQIFLAEVEEKTTSIGHHRQDPMDFTSFPALPPQSSTPFWCTNGNAEKQLVPRIFVPKPNSITTLLHSPTLAPRLPLPYSQLSDTRFLQKHGCIPSSSSSHLGFTDYSSHYHGFNSVEMLHISDTNLVIVFFPTGENSDRVGFSVLSSKAGELRVVSEKQKPFSIVEKGNVSRQRITKLLVNPVWDLLRHGSGDGLLGDDKESDRTVGFLMVCTDYSVSGYSVTIDSNSVQNVHSVSLNYLACAYYDILREKKVLSACWSPHDWEECLIMLEDGDLLLFRVNGSLERLWHLSLGDKLGLDYERDERRMQWVGCEFSWHPRVFIACCSYEVFLIDFKSEKKCTVSSLLKLEMLSVEKNDEFLAMSRAGSDDSFVVATRKVLLVCDVWKPLMPVLQWEHDLENPRYLSVVRLSDLRLNAGNAKQKFASESGCGIIIGSFWDNKFSLFCYGHQIKEGGTICSCNSYYAWGLPSDLPLSDSDCECGSCLVRRDLWRGSLPLWIDWRQKQHLVLGFGILQHDLSPPDSYEDQSFTLIRLTSSGNLEAQPYHAILESERFSECHKRKRICLEDNLLYDTGHSEYEGPKKFQYLRLEFLSAYLQGNLAHYMIPQRGRRKKGDVDARKRSRMNDLGIHQVSHHPSISAILEDISCPTSVNEIALSSCYAGFPANLLQMTFSTYFDIDGHHVNHYEPLEFLDIPEQRQAALIPFRKPSNRSNKWSSKVQPSDGAVGPILPPQFLRTLHKICMEEAKEEGVLYLEDSEELSADHIFKLECDKIMETVNEYCSVSGDRKQDDEYVSLADDTEDIRCQNVRPKFCFHKPSAFMEDHLGGDSSKPGGESDAFSTFLFGRREEPVADVCLDMAGEELFDFRCPVELKFKSCSTFGMGPIGLETLRSLKRRDLDFQKNFKPYQDYVSRTAEG